MKRLLLGLLILLGIAPWAFLGVFLLQSPDAGAWLKPEFLRAWMRVGKGMHLVHTRYLEPEKVAPNQLADRALSAIAHLDRYSSYLSAENYDGYQQRVNQTRIGIGADFQIIDRLPVLARIYADGGAEKAGLLSGDRLLAVEKESLANLDKEGVSRLLSREVNASVSLTVQRFSNGTTETFTRTVAFLPVHIPTVEDVRLLDDGVTGYLRIAEFKRHTATELATALATLERGKAKALVIDLRDNVGGNIESAVDAVGHFCPLGTLVATLRERGGRVVHPRYRTHTEPIALNLPLAILVNARTASSAELFSGALQDLRRAVVVGTPTRGKHVAQSIIPLDAGDGLRLTTAQYVLPSGRTTRSGGIRPDIEQTLNWRTRAILKSAAEWGAARCTTEFRRLFPEPLPKDLQLAAALDYLRVAASVDSQGGGVSLPR